MGRFALVVLCSVFTTMAWAFPDRDPGDVDIFPDGFYDLEAAHEAGYQPFFHPGGHDELLDLLKPAVADAYIHGGTQTSDFNEVAWLVFDYGGGYVSICSGTLMAPRYIVTAAHCVDDLPTNRTHYAYWGANIVNDGYTEAIQVFDWWQHPGWTGDIDYGDDIAVIELARSHPDQEPIVLSDEMVTNAWQGREIRFVGFGVTESNRENSGIKRTVVADFYDYNVYYIETFEDGAGICGGDSGGAALEETEYGFELVGVNSWGGDPCSYGWSGATRVDQYIDWLAGFADIRTEFPEESDTDVDTDTDTDTDSDTDTDTDGDQPLGDWDVPARPPEDAYLGSCGCTGVPAVGWLGWLPLGVLLGLRRRRG